MPPLPHDRSTPARELPGSALKGLAWAILLSLPAWIAVAACVCVL